jgi:vacuolar-type H+-ATPase subunit H
MAAIEARQKEIADGLSSAERAKKDLDLAKANATDQLKEAKLQAAEIIEQANKRRSQILDEAKAEAEQERTKIVTQAQAEIEAETIFGKDFNHQHFIFFPDPVFYSKFDFPSNELEKVVPLNMYGETKKNAENIILELNPYALIIRVNFFGFGSKKKINLLDGILTSIKSGKNFMGYTDVIFSPVSISELIKCTYVLLDLEAGGIFNLASSDAISKFEFAKKVCRIFEYNPDLIISGLSEDVEVSVKRVQYLALESTKFSRFTGIKIPTVEEMLLELKGDIIWQQVLGGLNV